MLDRHLPLHRIAVPVSFGSVTLKVIHPVSLVQVIARRGRSAEVAKKLSKIRSCRVMEAGPDQHYVQSDAPMLAELSRVLGETASVIDQSHGRVVFGIEGRDVRRVLAKGTPVDLHPSVFPIGKSALTTMAHVGIHLTRTGEDAFTLSVFRGFSESFWEWLVASSRAST